MNEQFTNSSFSKDFQFGSRWQVAVFMFVILQTEFFQFKQWFQKDFTKLKVVKHAERLYDCGLISHQIGNEFPAVKWRTCECVGFLCEMKQYSVT